VFKKSKLPILKKFYIYSLDNIYILNVILTPLSLIYLLINFIKKYFFSNNKLNKIPVIVIGNLTVGGTGKTSLVIWLCNYLSSRKYNIGVISGGYKTINENKLEIVDKNSLVKDVGDEAVLISNKTNCIVCKCKNRKKAYEYLVNNYELDLIISDDGLIHYKLNRDLNIVIVKENKPFGNGLLLPAGPLRELPYVLSKYDSIIFNKSKYSKLPGFYYDINEVTSFSDKSKINISDLSGTTIHLVTAIANPEFLINNLKRLNIDLITHIYPDHQLLLPEDFKFDDNYKILMTEKDFVKCSNYAIEKAYYMPTKIMVDNDIKIMLNDKISNLLKV
jgi:tetraacyldisaccharide 4'-kinase|tara:strand:+ start:431 stop:1429 length:999 start_codon:yes stop_codon:yes gene_type:complete